LRLSVFDGIGIAIPCLHQRTIHRSRLPKCTGPTWGRARRSYRTPIGDHTYTDRTRCYRQAGRRQLRHLFRLWHPL